MFDAELSVNILNLLLYSNSFLSTFLFVHIAGVAGGSASGKTAVCDMIIQQLHDQRVVLVNQVMHSFYIQLSVVKLKTCSDFFISESG